MSEKSDISTESTVSVSELEEIIAAREVVFMFGKVRVFVMWIIKLRLVKAAFVKKNMNMCPVGRPCARIDISFRKDLAEQIPV